MSDGKTNESLGNNYKLAADLGINGTPAYIVGEQLTPEAINADALTRIIAAERAKLNGKTAKVNEKQETQK